MNGTLVYIADTLSLIAFLVGFGVVIQAWKLRNEICVVFALMLFCYQTRNLITAITIWSYSSGLVRPSGLLAWSITSRVIEITGSVTGLLYFAGKTNLTWLIQWVLGSYVQDHHLTSGDMPLEYWSEQQYQNNVRAIRDTVRPDLLK